MQKSNFHLPILVLLTLLILPPIFSSPARAQGIYQQTNYWCDMRNQRTGSGDYRNPMQVLYNDNQQPLTWRPMSEDINAQPNPPSPTPQDVINRDGGPSQIPGLGGIQNNQSPAPDAGAASSSANSSNTATSSSTITQTSVTGQLSNYVMSDTSPNYSGLINP